MFTRLRLLHPSKRVIVKGVILTAWCALWLRLSFSVSASLGFAISLSDWRFLAFAALGASLAGGIGYLETREKLTWIYGIVEYAIIFAGFCYGALALLDIPWSPWWLLVIIPFVIHEGVESILKAFETKEKVAQAPAFLRSDKWKARLVALKYINSAVWAAFCVSTLLFAFLVLFRALP